MHVGTCVWVVLKTRISFKFPCQHACQSVNILLPFRSLYWLKKMLPVFSPIRMCLYEDVIFSILSKRRLVNIISVNNKVCVFLVAQSFFPALFINVEIILVIYLWTFLLWNIPLRYLVAFIPSHIHLKGNVLWAHFSAFWWRLANNALPGMTYGKSVYFSSFAVTTSVDISVAVSETSKAGNWLLTTKNLSNSPGNGSIRSYSSRAKPFTRLRYMAVRGQKFYARWNWTRQLLLHVNDLVV